MESTYEMLLSLPLFQGVSRERLLEVIEKTPFHFLKFQDGATVAAAGERCDNLRFIISGSVRLETASRSRRVTVGETLSSPGVIGPEYLFGLDTNYPFCATARGACGIMQVTKASYMSILMSDPIFVINVLNILSRNSQRGAANALALSSGSVAERLAHFVLTLTHQGAQEITVTFRQKDLCAVLGTQRTSLMTALSRLADEGVISYSVNEIAIPDRSRLADILNAQA